MKPRNKLERRIVALSSSLPKISASKQEWGIKNCFESYYEFSRNRMFCLECGHKWLPSQPEWHYKVAGCDCPSCGKSLKRVRQNGPYYDSLAYMSILDVVDGFQVERIVYMSKSMQKNKPARYNRHFEVIQKWFDESGKTITLALPRNMSGNFDSWIASTDLSIKDAYDQDQRYMIHPEGVHPDRKILPIFRRNGFKGRFFNVSPHKLFYQLIKNSHAETLAKANQNKLLECYIRDRPSDIERYFSSVKICIRNKYIVKDYGMWLDYMALLSYFNKDLRNSKYVCPVNLKKEHNVLMKRKQKILDIREEERRIASAEARRLNDEKKLRKLEEHKDLYIQQKQHFFDLILKDGDLVITPLKSVDEFKDEGHELEHCVFTNDYYDREDSLILSAKIDGKRIETIEVKLSGMRILQSRGINNKFTEYHGRIVTLVESNMDAIRKLHRKSTKEKRKEIIQLANNNVPQLQQA